MISPHDRLESSATGASASGDSTGVQGAASASSGQGGSIGGTFAQ